jgi:arsenate reductase
MITIYGSEKCSITKRARAWLEGQNIAYQFSDRGTAGIGPPLLERWISWTGWEALLDRTGIFFLMLPHETRQDLDNEKAKALMLAEPAMIRYPVLDAGFGIAAGFRPGQYERLFGV